MEKSTKTINRKTLQGVVVSDKMAKTVVVRVDRLVKHPKYGKFISVVKNFKVHDENKGFKKGDIVMIEECRPISKDKHFRVLKAIEAKS